MLSILFYSNPFVLNVLIYNLTQFKVGTNSSILVATASDNSILETPIKSFLNFLFFKVSKSVNTSSSYI